MWRPCDRSSPRMNTALGASRRIRSLPGIFCLVLAAVVLGATGARADNPWSVTLYAGPYTQHWASQILVGQFVTNGGMVGLAVDRQLVNLGSGISIGAEAQITQYGMAEDYASVALGAGLRFDSFPWSDHLRTTLAIYSGPSYTTAKPFYGRPFNYGSPRFLNFVSAEVGVGIPTTHADFVFRLYHRSAVWRLYGEQFDAGTMFGIGFRRRF